MDKTVRETSQFFIRTCQFNFPDTPADIAATGYYKKNVESKLGPIEKRGRPFPFVVTMRRKAPSDSFNWSAKHTT